MRRIWARIASVFAVFGLSVAMIVGQPVVANAFEDASKWPPIVKEGTKYLPKVMGVARFAGGPVGMVVGTAAMMGLEAWSRHTFRDENGDLQTQEGNWAGFEPGDFGKPQDSGAPEEDPVGNLPPVSTAFYTEEPHLVDNRVWSVLSWEPENAFDSEVARIEFHLRCQWSDGRILSSNSSNAASWNRYAGGEEKSVNSGTCGDHYVDGTRYRPADGTVIGWMAGPRNSHPLLAGSDSNNSAPRGIFVGGDLGKTDAFDPKSEDTVYTTTVECRHSDGEKFEITANTTGDEGGLFVPACPQGTTATQNLRIDGFHPGVTEEPQKLYDFGPSTDWANYPRCDPEKSDGCEIGIEIDEVPCTTGDPDCEDWEEINENDPNKERVKCRMGPYSVPLDLCKELGRAYELGGSWATDKNLDGDPSTRSDINPNTVAGANPGTERLPSTQTVGGNQVRPDTNTNNSMSTAPNYGTGTNPGSATAPGTGTTTGTGGLPRADAKPEETLKQCMEKMWTWNPVDWVMVPVQCALTWAFVPQQSVVNGFGNRITAAIAPKGLQPYLDAFAMELPGEGGCMGPALPFEVRGYSNTFYPFAACEHPMNEIAGGVKAFLSLGLVYFGSVSVVRGIGQGFGFNVTFGGRKGDDE